MTYDFLDFTYLFQKWSNKFVDLKCAMKIITLFYKQDEHKIKEPVIVKKFQEKNCSIYEKLHHKKKSTGLQTSNIVINSYDDDDELYKD